MSRRARSHLVTVLFTDIVGSTEIAAEVGDRRWKVLLEAHHAIVRRALRRHGGKELDTAGDGFFAVFSGQAQAIRCAVEIVQDVRQVGLEVRAGLHVGETELIAGKVGGVAVHTGARIGSTAGPGEVVVSGVLRDLVPGAGIEFLDRGTRRLKGISDEVRIWSVRSVNGVDLAEPIPLHEAATRRERAADVRRSRGPALLLGAAVGILAVALMISALWFRDAGAPSPGRIAPLAPRTLARIDPVTLTIEGRFSLEGEPFDMAVSAGRLWILEGGLIEVLRAGSARLERIDLEFAGCGIAATGDGVIVPDCEDDVLHRVDIDGTVSRWLRVPAFGDQIDVVEVGANIWLLLSRSDGSVTDRVYKLDAETGEILGWTTLPESQNDAFGFVEASGWLWISNYDTGDILRMSPSTLAVESVQELTQPSSMTSNGEWMWISDIGTGETVRIDPSNGEVEHRAERIQGNLTAGPGAAWALDLERLYRIGDDESVRGPVELEYTDGGSYNNPLAFDGASLWVAVKAADE